MTKTTLLATTLITLLSTGCSLLKPNYSDEQMHTYLFDKFDSDEDGEFDYAFNNPDFNYKSLNTNLVLRWEYKPGSSLFLVWSSGRSDDESIGPFNLSKNSKTLFISST